MGKRTAIAAILLALFVAWLALGFYRNHVRATGFEQVAVGNTRALVVARLGAPDHVGPGWSKAVAYENSPCAGACRERLWWENALLPRGFEAWSVDLDRSGRVIHTEHWVSP